LTPFSASRLAALRGAKLHHRGKESASVGALAAPRATAARAVAGVVSGALPLVEAALVGFVGI
jgi:hypothetical protein